MATESATKSAKVAYFSMEIALESGIPTYSGGLGVLAGDMLRSGADLGVPMVGITLIHRRGYFRQRLDARGSQFEEDAPWNPAGLLEENGTRASVEIEGRAVHLRAWKYSIRGISGHEVAVYLLDSDLEENTPWDRTSRITFTAVMFTTAFARKFCSASAVSGSYANSVTHTSPAIT